MSGKEHVEKLIDDLILEIDHINERLEDERDNRPLKIIGITASYELVGSLFISLATALFAIFYDWAF